MKKSPFARIGSEDLVVVAVQMNDHTLRFAIDTGATHSIIDLNALLMLGYKVDQESLIPLETANGVVQASSIAIKSLSSLGITRSDFDILSYDFLLSGITSFYDGMLGLDFFTDTILNIDFIHNQVWIEIE